MLNFFVNNWPLLVSFGTILGALVVFGKNLADLILKWRDVFRVDVEKSNAEQRPDSENNVSKAFSVIRNDRFEASVRSKNKGNLQIFRLKQDNRDLEYRDVLNLWENDPEFLDFYISIFKKCGFNSYIWETPPISTDTISQAFEFVLLNTPISSNRADPDTYKQYYDKNNSNDGVVSFPNLGHDAILVVPSPFRNDANYSGLAEFFRESPLDQQRSLWKVTARQVKLLLSEKPTWVSVAGGGIAWLHLRLDSTPKYYRYEPYTEWKTPNRVRTGV